MKEYNIGKDFSRRPYGRFRSDGPVSGEGFREDVLRPLIAKLQPGEKLRIDLDELDGPGSSFLTEAFGGMVKYGYMKADQLLSLLEFKAEKPDMDFFRDRILTYIRDARYNSKTYEPTKPRGAE